MAGAIGLSAYRVISQSSIAEDYTPSTPRADADLVWIHIGAPSALSRPALDLADQIALRRPHAQVLVTSCYALDVSGRGDITHERIISDHPRYVSKFFAHWRPDILLWVWGDLRPNLLMSASESGCALCLVDAGPDGFDTTSGPFSPEVPRKLLSLFDRWMCRSEQGRARLAQLGCALGDIEIAPQLLPMGETVSVRDEDLDDLRDSLASRPVWCARALPMDELDAVLEAHVTAVRNAHRLLLVIEPEHAQDGDAIMANIERMGLRGVLWSAQTVLTETTQVLVADVPDDTGLWLRVSRVCFVGGTLTEDRAHGADPLDIAAHGAAVLYGTGGGVEPAAFHRLANAGAAMSVSDAASLSQAVLRLIAPDAAAEMALAGWEISTRGASAVNRILGVLDTVLGPDRVLPD